MRKPLDTPTAYIKDYVENKGIRLTVLAKKAGVPYGSLRSSLGEGKTDGRALTADEYFRICNFLEIDPLECLE